MKLVNKQQLAVVLFCVIPVQAFSTTVIVVLNPSGIVVGEDSHLSGPSPKTGVKIRLLKKKLSVASIGAFQVGWNGTDYYSFPTWIEKIDKQTNPEISASELAQVIGNQMADTFALTANAIKTGNLTKDKAIAQGLYDKLVEYDVVGYDRGQAAAFELTLTIDWDTKTLKSAGNFVMEPQDGSQRESSILKLGRICAIERFRDADTHQQKEFRSRVPVEVSAIEAKKPLTLDQASNVVRALIGMETKAEPDFVAFPITVITIPRGSDGVIRTYERDVVRLSRLPKTKTPKETRTQKNQY